MIDRASECAWINGSYHLLSPYPLLWLAPGFGSVLLLLPASFFDRPPTLPNARNKLTTSKSHTSTQSSGTKSLDKLPILARAEARQSGVKQHPDHHSDEEILNRFSGRVLARNYCKKAHPELRHVFIVIANRVRAGSYPTSQSDLRRRA